jgi:hypothetical protein
MHTPREEYTRSRLIASKPDPNGMRNAVLPGIVWQLYQGDDVRVLRTEVLDGVFHLFGGEVSLPGQDRHVGESGCGSETINLWQLPSSLGRGLGKIREHNHLIPFSSYLFDLFPAEDPWDSVPLGAILSRCTVLQIEPEGSQFSQAGETRSDDVHLKSAQEYLPVRLGIKVLAGVRRLNQPNRHLQAGIMRRSCHSEAFAPESGFGSVPLTPKKTPDGPSRGRRTAKPSSLY